MHTRFRFRVASALGAVDLADVLARARDSVGPDHEGYHSAFVRMVEETQRLAGLFL
jgi:hypothetical protein